MNQVTLNQANLIQTTFKPTTLNQMSDILLPVPPEYQPPIGLISFQIVIGLLVLIVLFFLLWRFINKPIIKLERYLKQGKVSPREAAHSLAHLIPSQIPLKSFDTQLKASIDQLRFQRLEPDTHLVLVLINQVKNGR